MHYTLIINNKLRARNLVLIIQQRDHLYLHILDGREQFAAREIYVFASYQRDFSAGELLVFKVPGYSVFEDLHQVESRETYGYLVALLVCAILFMK